MEYDGPKIRIKEQEIREYCKRMTGEVTRLVVLPFVVKGFRQGYELVIDEQGWYTVEHTEEIQNRMLEIKRQRKKRLATKKRSHLEIEVEIRVTDKTQKFNVMESILVSIQILLGSGIITQEQYDKIESIRDSRVVQGEHEETIIKIYEV